MMELLTKHSAEVTTACLSIIGAAYGASQNSEPKVSDVFQRAVFAGSLIGGALLTGGVSILAEKHFAKVFPKLQWLVAIVVGGDLLGAFTGHIEIANGALGFMTGSRIARAVLQNKGS